jgi:hypothetical protein
MADDAMTAAEIAEFERLQSCLTQAPLDAVGRAVPARLCEIGWLGDPLQQPPRVVLIIAREVVAAS